MAQLRVERPSCVCVCAGNANNNISTVDTFNGFLKDISVRHV